jgi:hypothetical protein
MVPVHNADWARTSGSSPRDGLLDDAAGPGAGRLAPAPRASPACLFEPPARAVLQSMIAAPVAEVRKPLPLISGNLATGFAASSRNPPAISPKRVLLMQLTCRLDPVGPPARGSAPTEAEQGEIAGRGLRK